MSRGSASIKVSFMPLIQLQRPVQGQQPRPVRGQQPRPVRRQRLRPGLPLLLSLPPPFSLSRRLYQFPFLPILAHRRCIPWRGHPTEHGLPPPGPAQRYRYGRPLLHNYSLLTTAAPPKHSVWHGRRPTVDMLPPLTRMEQYRSGILPHKAGYSTSMVIAGRSMLWHGLRMENTSFLAAETEL